MRVCVLPRWRVPRRALRDVAAGEELTHTYCDPMTPVTDRRRKLWETYCFHCDCRKCTLNLGGLAGDAGRPTAAVALELGDMDKHLAVSEELHAAKDGSLLTLEAVAALPKSSPLLKDLSAAEKMYDHRGALTAICCELLRLRVACSCLPHAAEHRV